MTEVFENFTIVPKEEDDLFLKLKKKSVSKDVSYQPPINFLAELQDKMAQRKQQLESSDKVCFKEFDHSTGKFVAVSKEDREAKQKNLDEQLRELERKNREKQKRLESLKRERGGIFGGIDGGDLFAELKQRQQRQDETVFD